MDKGYKPYSVGGRDGRRYRYKLYISRMGRWDPLFIPGISALWQVDYNDEDRAEGGAHVEAGTQLELAPVGEGRGEVDGAHPLPLHYLVQATHAAAPAHGRPVYKLAKICMKYLQIRSKLFRTYTYCSESF
jgi:hypothetical protein